MGDLPDRHSLEFVLENWINQFSVNSSSAVISDDENDLDYEKYILPVDNMLRERPILFLELTKMLLHKYNDPDYISRFAISPFSSFILLHGISLKDDLKSLYQHSSSFQILFDSANFDDIKSIILS